MDRRENKGEADKEGRNACGRCEGRNWIGSTCPEYDANREPRGERSWYLNVDRGHGRTLYTRAAGPLGCVVHLLRWRDSGNDPERIPPPSSPPPPQLNFFSRKNGGERRVCLEFLIPRAACAIPSSSSQAHRKAGVCGLKRP